MRSALGTLRIVSMLWLLALETLIGILLAGSETEGSGTTETLSAERPTGILFTAAHTGTVEAIRFRTPSGTNGTATSVRVGIFTTEGSGASIKPAAFLTGSEGLYSGTLVKETTCEATGLTASVTEGQKYYLILLALGGGLRFKPTGSVETEAETETAAKTATVSTAKTWERIGGATGGPAFIAALGTEASAGGVRLTMVV